MKRTIAIATAVSSMLFAGLVALPASVSAQTTAAISSAQIEAELQALDAAIAQLEAQYGITVPAASGVGSTPGTVTLPAGTPIGTGTASAPTSSSGTGSVLLDIEANPALTSGMIEPGTANQHVASFIITNATQNQVTLSEANGIRIDPGANADIYMNMDVYVNGSLYGSLAGFSNAAAAANGATTTYPIAGTTPVTIAPGGRATVDIYADVSATAPLGLANTTALYIAVPNAISSSLVYGQTMTTGATAGSTGILGASTTAPTISSINPTSGGTGVAVTLTGSGFNTSSSVFMNGELAARNPTVLGSSTLSFIVPISLQGGCAVQSSGAITCSQTAMLEGPGTYQITVESDGISSNAFPFQLTNNPYYNYIP